METIVFVLRSQRVGSDFVLNWSNGETLFASMETHPKQLNSDKHRQIVHFFFINIVSVTYKLKLIDRNKEFELPVQYPYFLYWKHISIFLTEHRSVWHSLLSKI